MKKKIEAAKGDVFEVPLSGGKLGYGQAMGYSMAGFFALASPHPLSMQEVLESRVAFRCPCMFDAIREGRWRVLGRAPLAPGIAEPLRLWRRTGGGYLFLYEWTPGPGGDERRATSEEVSGLEESVIWDSRSIPERIEYAVRGEPHPRVIVAP